MNYLEKLEKYNLTRNKLLELLKENNKRRLSPEGVRVLGFIPDEHSRLVRDRAQSMKLEQILSNPMLSSKIF